VFPDQWGRSHDVFYNGQLGVWGTFDSFASPKLDWLFAEPHGPAPESTPPDVTLTGSVAVIKIA
jgi:hypothetical protein